MNRLNTFFMIMLLAAPLAVYGEQGVYVVKKGDTLTRISRENGVPVNVLKAVNRLDDASSLAVGVRLNIPAVHIVKKGDTLYGLSRRYRISVSELQGINRLSSGKALKIDQKLYFPSTTAAGGATAAVDASPRPTPPADVKSAVFWPHPGAREQYDGKIRGIVINGGKGDLVYSVSLGRVISAGPYRGFGNVILVSSGEDLVYGYMGIEELIVSVGEQIESGSVLGRMGVYFHQTDAKLLFIVYDNAKRVYLDPAAVLFTSTQAKE